MCKVQIWKVNGNKDLISTEKQAVFSFFLLFNLRELSLSLLLFFFLLDNKRAFQTILLGIYENFSSLGQVILPFEDTYSFVH